jgi:RNA dependent RNA polymerase
MEGNVCRYILLSKACVPNPKHFLCVNHSCDNCKQRHGIGLKDVSIKEIVFKLVGGMSTSCAFDQFAEAAKSVANYVVDPNEVQKLCILLDYEERPTKSLFNYLCRVFKAPKTIFLDNHWNEWKRKIKTDEVSFFLRLPIQVNSNLPLFVLEREHNTAENNIFEVETFKRRRLTEFPYIIQVALSILGFSSDSDTAFGKTVARYVRREHAQAIGLMYKKKNRPLPSIFASTNEFPLFFRCQLPHDATLEDLEAKLVLLQPQRAFDKRIYRQFGSDRFMELTLGPKCSLQHLIALTRFRKCGRWFRYLWCSKHKSPQAFVLFAEKGIGIPKDKELTVEDAMRMCIPDNENPDLTISKFSKRMKLTFSSTVQGPTITAIDIEMVPNFDIDGFVEIDGAGVISQGLLETVWDHYRKNGGVSSIDRLNYTGFQGRIGG